MQNENLTLHELSLLICCLSAASRFWGFQYVLLTVLLLFAFNALPLAFVPEIDLMLASIGSEMRSSCQLDPPFSNICTSHFSMSHPFLLRKRDSKSTVKMEDFFFLSQQVYVIIRKKVTSLSSTVEPVVSHVSSVKVMFFS